MLNDTQQVSIYGKYKDFRADVENDEQTDAMFCGQHGIAVSDLSHVKKRFPTINEDILAARRSRYAASLAEVDQALFKKAKAGDAKAADLIYRRFESWSPKQADDDRAAKGTAVKTFADLIKENT